MHADHISTLSSMSSGFFNSQLPPSRGLWWSVTCTFNYPIRVHAESPCEGSHESTLKPSGVPSRRVEGPSLSESLGAGLVEAGGGGGMDPWVVISYVHQPVY